MACVTLSNISFIQFWLLAALDLYQPTVVSFIFETYVKTMVNNIRRKWRLGAHRQLYTWRATEPLQDGTTPRGQQYPQPSHEPPPQCREKTKQNKTTLTWAPVTLKEIQWKPIK